MAIRKIIVELNDKEVTFHEFNSIDEFQGSELYKNETQVVTDVEATPAVPENKLTRYGIFVVIIASIFAVAFAIMSINSQKTYGSINDSSSSYESTTTRTAVTGVALTSLTTLSVGFGTLGSVTITGAGTGIVNLYDGTTTSNHSDSATTTLASFPASTAAGTYVFDSRYNKGLVVEIIGTVGTSTITWKK